MSPADSLPARRRPHLRLEPTTDFLAAKYGLPRESLVRFDVKHVAAPAGPSGRC